MSAPRQVQRGALLLEALLAFLIVSVGMLMLARLQTGLRLDTDLARQRSEAVRLAQQDMETLRGHSVQSHIASVEQPLLPADAGLPSNTAYTLTRTVATDTLTGHKAVTSTVRWRDRQDVAHGVALHSIIARSSSGLAAALALPHGRAQVQGPLGRSVYVPVTAVHLDEGRSLFRPTSARGPAWIIDNATGAIVARCTERLPAAPGTRPDLADCTDVPAQHISGVIRFSLSTPPNATAANDTPWPLDVVMSMGQDRSAASGPCFAEPMKVVSIGGDGNARTISVPAEALAENWGLPSWTELGEQFMAYHCAAVRLGGVGAVTRIDLQPRGWMLGQGADTLRLCLYPAEGDTDRAAAAGLPIVRNALLVRGPQACPDGTVAPTGSPDTEATRANLVTVALPTLSL